MSCRKILSALCAVSCLAVIVACNGSRTSEQSYIPQEPDYTDSSMWYMEKNDSNNSGADIFYVVSTWETEWRRDDGALCRYADTYNPQHRADMDLEISEIAEYMGEGNDFYSPYYRHMAIETWATLNEDTINARFSRISMKDVQAAFDLFTRERNPQRPFILAGFSQGGKAVVELLKTMPAEVYDKLVAAYVLGYKVTPEDIASTTNIKGAKGATDTGVTICYNSVSDVKYIQPVVAAPCAICINPVNWKTDDTPATLHDTITVTLSPEHHLLVLHGYSGSEYSPILGFLNVGDFHSCEPWLYRECLRLNIRERIKAYRNMQEQSAKDYTRINT